MKSSSSSSRSMMMMMMMRNLTRSIRDLDRRFLILIFLSLSFLLLLFLSSSSIPSPYQISSFAPLKSLLLFGPNQSSSNHTETSSSDNDDNDEFYNSRIALCLVGGARRFELTGPSIVDRILKVYPNSDLFLNSPIDRNSYKLSLLKVVSRIAAVRIFIPERINETAAMVRVLTADGSPNGIQGLLQYFNLVEGCLTLIKHHEALNNFTYDWIIRTRVDGYWSGPLDRSSFSRGHYLVPPGSTYGGLNDRLGIGDRATSLVALSRLSLIPTLDSAGFRQLNSETAFKAQLTTHNIPYIALSQPFCIVTDRKYAFPPARFGVPVAGISSIGPLSGAKCRPCRPVCVGPCVQKVMRGLDRGWSWTETKNGNGTTTVELCDAHGEWERGWERLFDRVAGSKLAESRRQVGRLRVAKCVADFKEMRRKAGAWESPALDEICRLGLDPK